MADYVYTRELVAGKYNIHFKGEDSKLHTEIETALPGKSVSKVKSNGTQVTVTLTPTLTAPEQTTLDTVVQDHKNNAATNIKDDAPSPYSDINLNINNSSGNPAYSVISKFIFRGTTALGTPTKIKIAGYTSATNGDVRIYDVTNSLVIVEKLTITDAVPTVIDLGVLANLPTGESIFEIQAKRAGGGAMFVDSLLIEF